jgi:polyisoprenoid-binding protein YceI
MRTSRIGRLVRVSVLTVLTALTVLAVPAALAAETYSIDPVHSAVLFRITHLGVSTFYGRFQDVSGTYVLDAENPAAAAFDVTIKAESVDTHNEKRDQHLKSPDFFNAKQFPVLTMKSKSVKKTGDKTMRVTADLTIHGVTKEVAFDVTQVGAGKDPWGGYRSGFDGSFTIKRSDYDVKFMPGALGEDVTIIVSVEGVRQ